MRNKLLSSAHHTSVAVSDEESSEGEIEIWQNQRLEAERGRSVRFSSISIREHAITIGDNPGGMRGPPLSIEWTHQHERTLAVDEYESDRGTQGRRLEREMILSASKRTDILRRAGFARNDIVRLTKPVNIARAQRKRTENTLNRAGLHMVSEMLSRKAMDAITLGGRKRKERELLKKSPLSSVSCPTAATSLTAAPSSVHVTEFPPFEKLYLQDNGTVTEGSDEVEELEELEAEVDA